MTESGLKLMSWLVGAALVTAMLAVPQAVDPWELPSLVLDRAAVADAIRFDRTKKRAPYGRSSSTTAERRQTRPIPHASTIVAKPRSIMRRKHCSKAPVRPHSTPCEPTLSRHSWPCASAARIPTTTR